MQAHSRARACPYLQTWQVSPPISISARTPATTIPLRVCVLKRRAYCNTHRYKRSSWCPSSPSVLECRTRQCLLALTLRSQWICLSWFAFRPPLSSCFSFLFLSPRLPFTAAKQSVWKHGEREGGSRRAGWRGRGGNFNTIWPYHLDNRARPYCLSAWEIIIIIVAAAVVVVDIYVRSA